MLSTPSQVICLTPVRNEAWILQRFLDAASQWADKVVIADQQSEDGSEEIAKSLAKVAYVQNLGETYDEGARQRLLIKTARRCVPGRRVFIALDADEVISANFYESKSWQEAINARPGTVLRFRWVNILPGFQSCWIPKEPVAFGFVDDGSEHTAQTIHSRRVPAPPGAPTIDLDDVVVLHFQHVAWQRMEAKQRWYQAWEFFNSPGKRPIQIYRQYHRMDAFPKDEIYPLPHEWLSGYDQAGIDFRSLASEEITWWDREVIQWLREYGPRHFRRIALWGQDWNAVAAEIDLNGHDLTDPRSRFDRAMHGFLAATQPYQSSWGVRGVQQVLRLFGW